MCRIPYKWFLVETRSQVDSLVLNLATRMMRAHALQVIKTAKVYPSCVVDFEPHYVQTYCITRLGVELALGHSTVRRA